MLVLDVSNNNGSIDWKTVGKHGIEAVYLKASEGLSYNDNMFASHRAAAKAAGVRVGAYHFARPDLHPWMGEEEANHFCSTIKYIGTDELRPVLDFEKPANLSASAMEAWARKFNKTVRTKFGITPIFYSYSSFIDAMHLSVPVGSGLWLANYSVNDGKEHPFVVPAPWKSVLMHQFTSRGPVVGMDAHADLSNAKTLRGLLAYPKVGLLYEPLYIYRRRYAK